jgi:predicted  nucleic acid-binding Zn-ribbon protein
MDRDLRQFSEQIDLEKERQSSNRKKIKKVKKQLGAEVATLNEELQGQKEKRERIEAEKADTQDTIEQLKDNFDDLNEQILRIDLKIS